MDDIIYDSKNDILYIDFSMAALFAEYSLPDIYVIRNQTTNDIQGFYIKNFSYTLENRYLKYIFKKIYKIT